jgi:hypothetical protein
MCSDKTNVNISIFELDHDNDPIFVSFDIEYDSIILQKTGGLVGTLNIGSALPV